MLQENPSKLRDDKTPSQEFLLRKTTHPNHVKPTLKNSISHVDYPCHAL